MSGRAVAGDAEKDWCVINPHGVRWQARFYSARAAWLRAMARRREDGETANQARERMRREGWRVERMMA